MTPDGTAPGGPANDGPGWEDLRSRVLSWRDDDPDPDTRAELDDLLARAAGGAGAEAARADLADRFDGQLRFGTAGLRGRMGAGPNRMNRTVVIRAAAGLAAQLHRTVPGTPRVVVGHDARRGSAAFARDTCGVLTAAGCTALLLPEALPTPVLAFAVRRLDADAGVMVTASHNPAEDNGYKVYRGGRTEGPDGRGVQIVPPADTEIAGHIAAVGRTGEVPIADEGWRMLDDGVVAEYLDAAVGLLDPASPRDLSLVITPLHGVGGRLLSAALVGAGFPTPRMVAEQAEPDPRFPTVPYPNPEEPGALDLAVATASRHGADLVVATDPDADRCAAAIPAPDPGGWRLLSGDELGCLLAEHLLDRRSREDVGTTAVIACSVVSSQRLRTIASAHGCRHVETLTGFKWLARVPGLTYAYEEALGYCVAPDLVRDKDGITATLLLAELVARLKAVGRTVDDALDDLDRRYGVHLTDALAIRFTGRRGADAAMARLRHRPPARIGPGKVTSVDDLTRPEAGSHLPATDALRFRTADGLRVIVRPSGTEPKLKCYLEVVAPAPGRSLSSDRAAARGLLRGAAADLSRLVDAR